MVFNCGQAPIRKGAGINKALKSGDSEKAAELMATTYTKAGGEPILANRRQEESTLFKGDKSVIDQYLSSTKEKQKTEAPKKSQKKKSKKAALDTEVRSLRLTEYAWTRPGNIYEQSLHLSTEAAPAPLSYVDAAAQIAQENRAASIETSNLSSNPVARISPERLALLARLSRTKSA
jgi:hypothetical protein